MNLWTLVCILEVAQRQMKWRDLSWCWRELRPDLQGHESWVLRTFGSPIILEYLQNQSIGLPEIRFRKGRWARRCSLWEEERSMSIASDLCPWQTNAESAGQSSIPCLFHRMFLTCNSLHANQQKWKNHTDIFTIICHNEHLMMPYNRLYAFAVGDMPMTVTDCFADSFVYWKGTPYSLSLVVCILCPSSFNILSVCLHVKNPPFSYNVGMSSQFHLMLSSWLGQHLTPIHDVHVIGTISHRIIKLLIRISSCSLQPHACYLRILNVLRSGQFAVLRYRVEGSHGNSLSAQ